MQPFPLLTPTAVAEQLGVSPRTLERWRRTGAGPAYLRAGRHVRYDSGEIHAWITRQTRGGTR